MSKDYRSKNIEVDLDAHNLHFGIVASRFNSMVTERLLDAAIKALDQHGVETKTVWVPGAYELPLAAQRLAATSRCAAIVALGCVIRGETPHFDYVAAECSSGLSRVGLDFDVPIGFGVLTVDTLEQAMARAGGDAGNKGEDAALAALEMVNVLRQID